MTNYKIDGDKIIITDGIDIKAALFSGQVFRVKTLSENKYFLVSTSHAAIIEDGETITITCDDVEYFVNYFDLNSDYSKILDEVTDEYALSAIGFSPKLKILRQDKFETVIDFIMSANNNIKRFSKTLELIAENYGEKLQFKGIEYSAFPTPTQLTKATIEELKALGTGYRDKYIFETARQIDAGFDLQSVCALDTMAANKKLCELMGVGEKVADCILLFAFQKYDAFPVDTWIEKLYHENYGGESVNRKEIRKFFIEKFGQYAGIIQQYLFYYKRS
ncbi:MAG: 8-oxoguanine DNA glycosylase [Clostridia bacterium]